MSGEGFVTRALVDGRFWCCGDVAPWDMRGAQEPQEHEAGSAAEWMEL